MPTQKKTVTADPAIVAVEGPAAEYANGARGKSAGKRAGDERGEAWPDAVNAGGNNEQLPERLQEALRRLVQQFSTESESTRRQEIRRIKQAHQFWRGLQYLWWDERDQNWHLPFEQKLMDNSSLEDLPRYEFVTNIYQAFGLSLMAVLSQDVPRVRFFPSSAQAEEDVAAAKAATEVAQLVERNNRDREFDCGRGVQPLDGWEGRRVRAVRGGWAEIRISSGDGDWVAGSSGGRGCVCVSRVREGKFEGGERRRC